MALFINHVCPWWNSGSDNGHQLLITSQVKKYQTWYAPPDGNTHHHLKKFSCKKWNSQT